MKFRGEQQGSVFLLAIFALLAGLCPARSQDASTLLFATDAAGNFYIEDGTAVYFVDTVGDCTDLTASLPDLAIDQAAVDPQGNVFLLGGEADVPVALEIDAAGKVTPLSDVTFPPDAVAFASNADELDQLMGDVLGMLNGAVAYGSSTVISGGTFASTASGTDPAVEATSPLATKPAVETKAATAVPLTSQMIFSFYTPNQTYDDPDGVAVDAQGNYYIADGEDDDILRVTPLGTVSVLFFGLDGPEGIAVDAAENVYVADTFNDRVIKRSPSGQITVLAQSPQLAFPTAVAVDSKGNVYIADPGNHVIDRVTPTGVFSIFAGISQVSGDKDGKGTVALFDNPSGVAVDKAGNVYVADTGNAKLRKITAAGVVSTLVAKEGTMDLDSPVGITVDSSGNVYVTDTVLNSIYEFTAAGAFYLVGGPDQPTSAGNADGTRDEAEFNDPIAIAVDTTGNLYVADTENEAVRIGLLNHPPSYLSTGTFHIGEQVALSLETANGKQFIYYNIASGPAQIAGEDSNIVDFTGAGAVKVGTGYLTITDGSSGWHGHQIHQGDPATQPGQPVGNTSQKYPQAMSTFGPLPNHVYGDAPFTIAPPAATDSSGVPVTLSVMSGPAVMSGTQVTLTGIGTVVVAANQTGNTNYNPAPQKTASFKVAPGTATIQLGNLNATYDGTPHGTTANTTPSGLSVGLMYGRSATAPTVAGSYVVAAKITDPRYTGSATGTLVIAKATASISLSNLSVTYSGKAILPTVTTMPAGLPVTFKFTGVTAAVHAGSYPFIATVNSPNATGTASDTLVIHPATATVTVTSKSVPYTGKPVLAVATTSPVRLPVSFTYNGSSTAPSGVGSYNIVGTITNPDYQGSGSGTLNITAIAPIIVTGAASAIGSTQATVSATVTTEDSSTTVSFVYGTSKTALTSTSNSVVEFAASGSTALSVTLTGLSSSTIYYYEATATNSGGTKTGVMKSFKAAP